MAPNRRKESNRIKRFGAIIITIVGGVAAAITIIQGVFPTGALPTLDRCAKIALTIPVGLAAGICHGFLWSRVERYFGWRYGAGGGDALPSGMSAAALSLTLTGPLVVAPPLAAALLYRQILPPDYFYGALAFVVAGCIAHWLMYGPSRSIPGLRRIIMPMSETPALSRALFMEFVYALVYFGIMGLSYRAFAETTVGTLAIGDIEVTLWAGGIFWLGMLLFICERFPDSLDDPTWIQVRGFYSGLLLPICLTAILIL